MNHIQVSIEATEEQQELLISSLTEMGATGFEQTSTHLLAYFDEQDFRSYDVNEIIKGFSFQLNTIEQQNWNKVWESNFQPVIVDDFCAIRAHFHEPITSVQHEIIITPKMSFGTGHHATTYMMIQQMRKLNFTNKQVFDFGTGTGILAVLAQKLGALATTAIDIDEWSIDNAAENISKNKVEGIELYQSSQVPLDKTFDIILANINKNVILENIAALSRIVVPGGSILLSGLLAIDEQDIQDACSKNKLSFENKQEQSNWISLLFKKA